MVLLHEQLGSLMASLRGGLIEADEYETCKRKLLEEFRKDTEATDKKLPQEKKARRAYDSIISGVDDGEYPADVYPLPFPAKAGASSRAEIEEQEYHNKEMWEVYKVHHKRPLSERQTEVHRRWVMQHEVLLAKEDVKNAIRYAQSAGGTEGKTAPRRGGRSVNTPHTRTASLRFTAEDMNDLLNRVKDLAKHVQHEHDDVLMTPLPILPVELLGKQGMFDKKPHLYKMLRTSEISSIDAHRLHVLGTHLSLLRYLSKKVLWCMEAMALPCAPKASSGPAQQSTPLTSLPPVMMAWKKFAKSASNEFKESELRLVSEETLETLLEHFGKHLTTTECYWVTLQLRIFQGKAQSGAQHPSTQAVKPSGPVKNLDMQQEIDVIRDTIYIGEAKEEAVGLLREEFSATLGSLLNENVALINERNNNEVVMVERLVEETRRECDEAFVAEKQTLEQRIKDMAVLNTELQREMDAKVDAMQQIMEEKIAIAELATKNEINKNFQKEFAEVKNLREYYESEVQILRGQMELCNAQNNRLNTELSSSYGKRTVEDLKKKIRAEVTEQYAPLLEASNEEIRHLTQVSTAFEQEIENQAKALSEAKADNLATEQLYKECLAEVRESVILADQRKSLVSRLDDAFSRVTALSEVGSAIPTPVGSPPRPAMSPPIPTIKVLESPPVMNALVPIPIPVPIPAPAPVPIPIPIPAPIPIPMHKDLGTNLLEPPSDTVLISPSRPASEARV